MRTTLFVINGSHPCVTVEQALHLKGVPFRRIELLPGGQLLMRLGFKGRTVPAIRFEDGERVQGSRAILHALEERSAEPALYGGAEIEEAERWGDETYQSVPRSILWPALSGRPEVLHAFQADSTMPKLPLPVIRAIATTIVALERRLNATSDERAEATIAELPALLDHVDALIAAGVLNGDAPNAADLQIAPTTRLLLAFADLRPLITGRPAEAHARRWLAPMEAEAPAGSLPASWIPTAGGAAAAEPVAG